jgi:hypothetical protein
MKFLLFALSAFFLFGCAHHRDVRPSDDGIHRVVVQSDDSGGGARDAIKQAEHYCKEEGKRAAFVQEENKYTGDMDEKTYKTSKTAAKVAKGVGSAGYVFGGSREKSLGGIVGLGGMIADGALGKGYTSEMRFKCK